MELQTECDSWKYSLLIRTEIATHFVISRLSIIYVNNNIIPPNTTFTFD